MNSLLIYSIELSAGLAIFYLIYCLFFYKDTHFILKRWYLNISLLIAFIIPNLNFNYKPGIDDNFISKNIFSPLVKYNQTINSNLKVITKSNPDIFQNKKNESSDLNKKQKSSVHREKNKNQFNSEKSNIVNNTPIINTYKSTSNIDLNSILFIIYIIGIIFFLLCFILNILQIFKYTLQSKIEKVKGVYIVWVNKEIPPFSFLNYIFISTKEKEKQNFSSIILHEKIHIEQKHTFDIILIELLLVFQWYNPFIWLYRGAVKRNHEFLADQGVIKNGVEIPYYQYTLLYHFLGNKKFEVASNYSCNDLKVRINMLTRKRSSRLSMMKFLLIIPSIIFLCLTFSFNISVQSGKNDFFSKYRNPVSVFFNQFSNNIKLHKISPLENTDLQNNKIINYKTKKTTFLSQQIEQDKCMQTESDDISIKGINCSVLTTQNGITYIMNDSIPYTGQCYCNHETGEKGMTGSYVNGKESGKWIFWYKNGQKKMEYQEVNGQKNGNYYAWYKNGTLRIDARYNMGEIDDLYKCWHENGTLKKESCFNNGVPYDSSVFDENGFPDKLL